MGWPLFCTPHGRAGPHRRSARQGQPKRLPLGVASLPALHGGGGWARAPSGGPGLRSLASTPVSDFRPRAWRFASGRPNHTAPRAHVARNLSKLVSILVAKLVVFLWYLSILVTLCKKPYSTSLQKNTSFDKYHKETTSFATSIGTSFDKFHKKTTSLGAPRRRRLETGPRRQRPSLGLEAGDPGRG